MNLHSHPYNAYRASNGEWTDKTPSEWEEKRVKDLFRLVTEKAANDNDHELLSLYASIGVRPRKDLEARGNKASSTDGYWLVKKGDIVVNKLLAWMGSVGLSEYDGVTSPAYDVLRKTSKLVDVRYYSYLFRTEIAKQIFKKNSRGIMDMRLRLYFDKLGAITVPVPPFSTQQAIATYIDTKTTQIDHQMDLLGKKAAQYGKLKQSLISETVTRGLDKSVPMKESGEKWIGEVPAHWEFRKISQSFSQIGSGTTPKSDAGIYYEAGTTNWINTGDLNDGILHSCKRTISKRALEDYSLTIYPAGSLIVAMYGATIGKVAISMIEGCTNQACCVLNGSKSLSVNFLFYWLISNRAFLISLSYGGGQPNISQDTIKSLRVSSPSFVDQVKIAAHLDKETGRIDAIVNAINSQIDKLANLRKALINDVVSGKIKVLSEGQVI